MEHNRKRRVRFIPRHKDMSKKGEKKRLKKRRRKTRRQRK